MLYVDLDLPVGALLSDPPPAPEAAGGYGDFDGISLDAADLEGADEHPDQWPDTQGVHLARPAGPNTGNARVGSVQNRPILCLTNGVNCGFALEDIMLNHGACSMAVLFAAPAEPAGTLLTLNPCEGRNYLFLAAAEGQVTLKFRDGGDPLTCPVQPGASAAPRGDFILACAAIRGPDMTLAVNNLLPLQMTETSGLQAGAHDLFIGCRSDRAGIIKTLGAAQIARVWLWPDRDIFADTTHAALTAVWRGIETNPAQMRPRHGL